MHRFVPRAALFVTVVMALGSGWAWGGASPPAEVEPPLFILDGGQNRAAVVIPWLERGDMVEVELSGAEGPPVRGGGEWFPVADRPSAWSYMASSVGRAELEVDLGQLAEGSQLRVTLRRPDPVTGDEIQASRVVRRTEEGLLEVGGGSVARIRRMVELGLADSEARAFPALERAGENRYRLRETDPALPAILPLAGSVRHLIQATVTPVKGPPTKDWVTASNGWDADFTDYICGNHFGSLITISSAPGGATVTGFDVQFDVYHSVDISRFRAAIWHKDPPGSANWTGYTQLYNGTSSGSNTYHGSSTGRHEYDGSLVNTDYTLGCCNIYGNEVGYLDSWTLTVYFSSSGGVDLVADSITPAYSTVARGGTAGARWQAHVAGSGSVGSGFTTGLYLSTDATITTGDRLLATRDQEPGLNAGDTFGDSMFDVLFQIPSSVTPGNYWLGILVDNGGAVTETSETNNAMATAITVVDSSGLPNLVASDCSVSPSSADAGDTVTLSYRYRNTGATGAPYFVWSHFLSADSVFDSGDTLLVGLDVLGGYPAGYDSGITSMSVTLPATLADGTYYLGTVLDQGDQVVETDEGDNWCTARITIGSGGGGGPVRWLVPAAASTPGFGGSNWKTQLAIVNPDSTAHQVSVYYVAKGASWPGSLLVPSTSLSPGQSLFLDDPLVPFNPTSGLMYVECDSAGPVVTTRTFNLAGGGATYGQGIPAVELSPGSCHAYILPMVHSVANQYHTNIGLVQADSGSVTYRITLYSSTGAMLGTKTYTRTSAFEQINDVFSDMGLGAVAVTGGWARVELEVGCPSFWTTYASVVDDRTGDPTYVMPVPE